MAMRTAYLTFSYPAISQTFVVHEVQALRALGFEVQTWGIRRPDPDGLLTDEYRAEAAGSRALRPLSWSAARRAHIRALRSSPRGYAATLVRAIRDRPPGLRAMALAVAAFVVGISLWNELERSDTRHLHVHFAGSPTHIAELVTRFGNTADSGRRPWTWSVSVHGPVEFADLSATRLPERIRNAAFVVAVSDFARSQLLSHLPVEQWDKVRVVRCGVRPSSFEAQGRADAGAELRILCVGRLIALKGQRVLLEALAGLHGRGIAAHMTLVGDGPERDGLERLVVRIGVAEHVTFTGALGQDAVREHYREADVFCLASFAEGVPVVLMEAMAARLPVVSTRLAGIPELVEDGVEGLLVRPGRADLVEEALASLAADPERRRAMGENGRTKVERDHDAEHNAARLAALHREFRR